MSKRLRGGVAKTYGGVVFNVYVLGSRFNTHRGVVFLRLDDRWMRVEQATALIAVLRSNDVTDLCLLEVFCPTPEFFFTT